MELNHSHNKIKLVIQLIIFDMAGTTVNESNIVYKTIQSVIEDFGYDLDLDFVLLHGAGKEKWQAIHDILQELVQNKPDNEEVSRIYRDFEDKLKFAYNVSPMHLFDGVLHAINQFRKDQIKVAFNTGYSRSVAESILRKVDVQIGRDIDLLVTSSEVQHSRPAPDMIVKACEVLGIAPENSIKIGDSKIDIEEGKNAGVKYNIGITTGAQQRQILEQAEPDFIIDHMDELLPIIATT